MNKISKIGSFLKKIYRTYNAELIERLQNRGFIDLRPSFLEILIYLCEHDLPSIKEVGDACALKKQTMTSHLNELEKRGYILRKTSAVDRREQLVSLTDYGHNFKLTLTDVISKLEMEYTRVIGAVEIDRIEFVLQNFYTKLQELED